MQSSRRTVLAAGAGLALSPLPVVAAAADGVAAELLARSAEGQAALMQGDAQRYFEVVPLGDDFTLMSPFGGTPSHGPYTPEQVARIGDFFRNGRFTQDEVARYETTDMVVLVVIEHAAAVEVGGLAAQDWDLRVTLVYRRDADGWRLVHRHADPLAVGISLETSAALGRGSLPPAS
jgi:ketosteroid isomerase-like protein